MSTRYQKDKQISTSICEKCLESRSPKEYQCWDNQIVPLIAGIQDRGYVTFYELMKIGAWKAALPLAYLTLNIPDRVEKVTAEAIKRARDGRVDGAIEVLGELEGMKNSLKMRSAVLAVALYPHFPVIDKYAYRVTEVLSDESYVPDDIPDDKPETYVKYFHRVESKAKEWHIDVKEADWHLMKIGMCAEKLKKQPEWCTSSLELQSTVDSKEKAIKAIKIAARLMEEGA